MIFCQFFKGKFWTEYSFLRKILLHSASYAINLSYGPMVTPFKNSRPSLISNVWINLYYATIHIGSFGQIWDKRLSQKYNCLYYFCLWMFPKTNGTNEKDLFQQQKNTFSSFTPSKLGKCSIFRVFHRFFKHVYYFFG